ncbi:MAG: fibronectin type III domain-containing protein [Eubacteriales bacterium]
MPSVTAPTVSTGTHSGVTSSGTSINGNNLSNMGNADSVDVGVAYSTSTNPTTGASSGTNYGTGNFSASLSGLSANTTYYYRAYATNSAGTSYGAQSSFTTLPNAPAVGISIGTISATSISLSATVNNNGGTVSSKGFDGLSWSGSGDGDFSNNFTGLTPNTQYSVRAYATNAGGTGYSGYISPRTLAAVPGLVSVNSYQPNGDVVLSINRNGNPSGTQFFVQRATDASFTQNLATALDWYNPGAGTTLTIPKAAMNAGAAYYFRIMARNADNIATAWGAATVSIPMRISDAPGTPTVTPSSDTQMTAAWTAATGAATYDVYENDVRVVTATAGTSATRPGLTPNTLYKYEIVSNNVSGSSGKSASTSKYTLATVPDLTTAAPQQNGNVILTVDKHNNPDATQYYVEKAKTSDFSDAEMAVGWTALDAGQNTFTISSLDLDENYYFRIKARNGDNIETACGVTAACITVPTTPSILSVDPASNHSITLTWNDVRVDSTQITYYIYENDMLVGSTTETTYTHTGLTPNTVYSYKVTAENANNLETVKSAALTAGTLATTPEIDAIEAQANGTAFIYIDGKDNPSDTEYYIEKSTNSTFPAGASTTMGVNWDMLDGNGKMTVSGLANGTVYYYRVKARNNDQVARLTVQETAWGDALQSTVITVPAPLSGAPSATVNSTSKVTISWSAVSGAFDYMLYRNGTFVKAVTGTETTDVGLEANTGVVYKVIPRNSSGISSLAHPESAIVYTNAAVPSLTLTAQPSGIEVKVTVAPNGNMSGTQYQVEVSLTGGVEFSPIADKTTAWSTTTDTAITGLIPGTQYYFRVSARNGNNGAGTSQTSAHSEIVSTYTVVGQPDQPTTSDFTLNSITVSWNEVTGATGYKLYRDGVYEAQTSALTYKDTALTPNSAYTYSVTALNEGGMSEHSTDSVTVYTKAALPTSAAVADATSDRLIFNITPSNANDVEPQYKIIIKIKSSGVTAQETSWSRNTSRVEVMGLTPGVEYEVWMAARNEGSPVTKLVTDGEAPAIASVYTNSPPEGSFTNDATGVTTLRSYQTGHNDDFTISGKRLGPVYRRSADHYRDCEWYTADGCPDVLTND